MICLFVFIFVISFLYSLGHSGKTKKISRTMTLDIYGTMYSHSGHVACTTTVDVLITYAYKNRGDRVLASSFFLSFHRCSRSGSVARHQRSTAVCSSTRTFSCLQKLPKIQKNSQNVAKRTKKTTVQNLAAEKTGVSRWRWRKELATR